MEIAKWMIAIVAVYNFAGVLFDAVLPKTAAMHIHNPAWPPHAKFHNGQTMMVLAPLFPGTLWIDPEFEGVVPRRFGLNPQQFVTYVLCAFWAVAVLIAVAAG